MVNLGCVGPPIKHLLVSFSALRASNAAQAADENADADDNKALDSHYNTTRHDDGDDVASLVTPERNSTPTNRHSSTKKANTFAHAKTVSLLEQCKSTLGRVTKTLINIKYAALRSRRPDFSEFIAVHSACSSLG